MKTFINRLLYKYYGLDWLLQRKARTFLFLNITVIIILIAEVIISSLLLQHVAPESISNLSLAFGLSLLMIPLVRGHYHVASGLGVFVVLIGISWTRYASTGFFSSDASYDFLQYVIDLIIVLFYSNLIARKSMIISATFIASLILLGIYVVILPTHFHAMITPAAQSVFFSGFLFIIIAGLIGLGTFLQNRKAIDVANQESTASRESERNYREIFNSTSEAIFIHDATTGKILEVNDVMLTMYGFTSKEQAINHSLGDLSVNVFPYTNTEAQQHLYNALHVGPQIFEWLAKKQTGEPFWVEVSLRKSDIGGHGRILGVVRDISNRKRSDEALQESEQRFRSIVEGISDALFIARQDGSFIEVNNAACIQLKYTREELLRMSVFEIIAKEEHPLLLERMQNIENVGRLIESKHLRKDGVIIPVELAIVKLVFDGKPIMAGVARDITERKKSEEALLESTMQFQTLVENIPDIIARFDKNVRYLFVNSAINQVSPMKPANFVGKTLWEVGFSNEQAEQRDSMIRKIIDTGKPIQSELEFIGVNGRHVYEWRGYPEFDAKGNIQSVLTFNRDITDRKHTDEALRHAQKLESIGTLAGGIAHDFNNLLNAILGQTSLALNKIPKESPAAINISKAIKASERAADLTRQLLAYSGKGKFYTEEIDLNTLVTENIQMLEVSIPKTTQLRYDLGHPSPRITGDIGQIQQVIMNLIINAGEAIGVNPGYITLRTSQVELTHNSKEFWKYTNNPLSKGSYALVQVKDTGSGISKESLTRIFDPFFTTKFTGRGLGLAAVIGIIRGHNGGLRIESEEGKGTTFEIVLPIAKHTIVPNFQEKNKINGVKGNGRTILVIDDDTYVFELLQDILAEAHFTVIGVLDPIEGINLYRQKAQEIEMVILDYSMPGMDGKTAFEELQKINKEVKVLLCSGYTEEETFAAFGTMKPAGFFQKPYKPDELLERVSRMISDNK